MSKPKPTDCLGRPLLPAGEVGLLLPVMLDGGCGDGRNMGGGMSSWKPSTSIMPSSISLGKLPEDIVSASRPEDTVSACTSSPKAYMDGAATGAPAVMPPATSTSMNSSSTSMKPSSPSNSKPCCVANTRSRGDTGVSGATLGSASGSSPGVKPPANPPAKFGRAATLSSTSFSFVMSRFLLLLRHNRQQPTQQIRSMVAMTTPMPKLAALTCADGSPANGRGTLSLPGGTFIQPSPVRCSTEKGKMISSLNFTTSMMFGFVTNELSNKAL
mmetsp:Transcript_99289/g.318535  ORF Transcript_99289/g.318535 Transcript_99289/m.318535 type:complete len:271 (-) Transcript_99289:482-1294(-)